jgi:hypothetical protein
MGPEAFALFARVHFKAVSGGFSPGTSVLLYHWIVD